MISFKKGKVVDILEKSEKIAWLRVNIERRIENAVSYTDLTGDVEVGDEVVLNTTAVELSLGTGGQHFVIHNCRSDKRDLDAKGHIMKLRYTPMQTQVLACEEEDSPHHEAVKNFVSLDGSKFVIGVLHSMVAPIAAAVKYLDRDIRINYIMTDGGALPMDFSKTVVDLKAKGIIDSTITAGQAFGGDYETVNIYTALIVAKEVLKSDLTIVAMGPGISGTGTKYGFSGIEQGYISDAVVSMGGKSISVPRISFADKRERHKGLSHHSVTIFNEIMNNRTSIVFPNLSGAEREHLNSQIEACSLLKKHNVFFEDGEIVKEAMDYYGLRVRTMGRGYEEDKAFFDCLGAVARYSVY